MVAAAACALVAANAPDHAADARSAPITVDAAAGVVTTHPLAVPSVASLITVAMADQAFFEQVAVLDQEHSTAHTSAPGPVTEPATTERAPAAGAATTTTTSPPVSSAAAGVPAEGQATAWGCAAALAYLQAYAAPGFTLECPGPAQGHEATTCKDNPVNCPGSAYIGIADPCPAAYMNEAHNSWLMLDGAGTDATWDPFGACPA